MRVANGGGKGDWRMGQVDWGIIMNKCGGMPCLNHGSNGDAVDFEGHEGPQDKGKEDPIENGGTSVQPDAAMSRAGIAKDESVWFSGSSTS